MNLLEPLCETESGEKAQEQYGLLLEKAKSGTTGLECLRSLGVEDVIFTSTNGKVEFLTPQSRKLGTSIKEGWYVKLRSRL